MSILVNADRILENKIQGKGVKQMPLYTVEEIKDIVAPIARKYGVKRIYLFGSYAHGNATCNSDVDLRIDKGTLKGMFALCGLYTEIEQALNMKIDLLTTGSLDQDFLKKISEDEVLLYAQ